MTATTEGVFSPALRLVTVGLLVSVGIVAFDGLGVTTEASWVSFRPRSSRRIGVCPRSTPLSSRPVP